jgi:lipopolysaccharide export system permease protein
MNAAGVPPWRLLRPFLAAAIVVSILVAVIAAYVSPRSLRALRDWGAQVRADILTNIVQPGRFTTIGGNLTFHIADRRPNGLLIGIFVDDRRDPNEHATYLAEQGEIVKNDSGSFLVLDGGSIHRQSAKRRLHRPREVPLGTAVAAGRRHALCGTAERVPIRAA